MAAERTILISAGEASGDTYGAQLAREIGALAPGVRLFGMGGDRMKAAGCDLAVHARDVAVMGLTEVVSHLPRIYAKYRKLLAEADRRKPAAAVLIDFPDFHFRLARQLHRRGIPVYYYVSPQLWAWRRGRIKLVQRYVRKMLVIFPFEADFYRERNVEADFVGHPLASLEPPAITREQFALRYGLDAARPWIALLPGSRRKEIALNLPEMVRIAERLGDKFQYVMPVATTIEPRWITKQMGGHMHVDIHTADDRAQWAYGTPEIYYTRNSLAALHLARAAVVASGTATMEAALMGVPFVAVYKLSPLTYALASRMVKLEHVAMPNLIAGREVVAELLQDDFTAAQVVGRLGPLIEDGPERRRALADLAEVRDKLQSGGASASRRAAETILHDLGFHLGAPSAS